MQLRPAMACCVQHGWGCGVVAASSAGSRRSKAAFQIGSLSASNSQPTARTAGCGEGWLSGNRFHRSGLLKELESLSNYEMQPAYDTVYSLLVKINKRRGLSRYTPSNINTAGCAWECSAQTSTYRAASLLAPRQHWLFLTHAGSYGAN